MQTVKLRSTQLHQLPPLQHIGHSLIYLELSRSKLSVQDFSYLPKIEDIILRNNGLQSTSLGLNHIANTVLKIDFMLNSIQAIMSMEGIKLYKLQIVDIRLITLTNDNQNPELWYRYTKTKHSSIWITAYIRCRVANSKSRVIPFTSGCEHSTLVYQCLPIASCNPTMRPWSSRVQPVNEDELCKICVHPVGIIHLHGAQDPLGPTGPPLQWMWQDTTSW